MNNNPVFLYGLAGAVLGSLGKGSKKQKTEAAFAMGVAGAAAGYFFDKSAEKKQTASIRQNVAEKAAAQAAASAVKAEAEMAGYGYLEANRPRKGTPEYRRARRMLYARRKAAMAPPAVTSDVGMLALPGVF